MKWEREAHTDKARERTWSWDVGCACTVKIRGQVVSRVMKERRTAGNSQNSLVRVCACWRMCMFVHVFVCLSVFGASLWACQIRHIPEVPSSQTSSGAHPANASDTRSTQLGNRQTETLLPCVQENGILNDSVSVLLSVSSQLFVIGCVW